MSKARSGPVGREVARAIGALPLIVLAASLAALPPAELFFRLPEIGDAQLSPSGSFLAVAAPVGCQRRGLAVLDLEGQAPPRLVAGFADRDVGQFRWVGNEMLVYGLFAVQRDGSGFVQLINLSWERPPPGVRRVLDDRHVLLHVPAEQVVGEETVIASLIRPDARREYGSLLPKRLMLRSGRAEVLEGLPRDDALAWLFDRRGEARVAVSRPRVGQRSLLLRGPDGWRRIDSSDVAGDGWRVHGLDEQARLLVLKRSGPRGEATLRRFDEARGAPSGEPLVDVPGFGFQGELVQAPDGGEPLGVRALGEAETTVWTDAGTPPDTRLPTVLLAHGGPWVRGGRQGVGRPGPVAGPPAAIACRCPSSTTAPATAGRTTARAGWPSPILCCGPGTAATATAPRRRRGPLVAAHRP